MSARLSSVSCRSHSNRVVSRMLAFSGIATALCFGALASSCMHAQAAYFSGSVNKLGGFDFAGPFGVAVDRF
jgi:hypothetical protein